MIKVLNEILSIDLNDNVKYDIIDITDIREEDEYGGNKYHIVGNLNNLKVNLEIDISTGDKVTPRKLKFKYPLLFEKKTIMIYSYNIESILAEKIETVLRRGKFNSRMKDYYDIYYFLNFLNSDIDTSTLKKAINNTFSKRESFDYLNDYKIIINSIRENDRINNQWKIYSNKYQYANNIEFKDILNKLKKYIDNLDLNKEYNYQ